MGGRHERGSKVDAYLEVSELHTSGDTFLKKPRNFHVQGGLCPRGCPGGVSVQGWSLSWGVSLTETSPLWTEWQTGVKILPCPKLRLRAVNRRMRWLHVPHNALADPRLLGPPPPPFQCNFFHFHASCQIMGFYRKLWGWRLPVWEILDPSLQCVSDIK